MSVAFGGSPFGTIQYLNPSSIDSYPDVVLVSEDGLTFTTNRMMLASVSPMFHSLFVDMELRLASPSDEYIYVLTDLTSLQLKNIIDFVRYGIIPVTTGCANMLDISLVEDFLSFGIDLTQLNLVFNESTNPGWDVQGTKLEPQSPLQVNIKSEEQSEDFEEIAGLPNESPSFELSRDKRKFLNKIDQVKKISTNPTERVPASKSTRRVEQSSSGDDPNEVYVDEADSGQDCSEDPDFEVKQPATAKRKYKKRNKLEERIEDKSSKISKPQEVRIKLICPHCPKKFGCSRYLKQHIFRHETEDKTKKWFCTQCVDENISFETKNELKSHKLQFHINQTYTCAKCEKVFNGNYYHRYKRHLAEHDKPPKSEEICVCCGFKAKSLESLARHKLTYGPFHDGKCPSCQMEFDSWPSYENHVSKDHGGVFVHKCGLCPKAFDTIQRMRIHRKEDHFNKGDLSDVRKKRKISGCEQQQVCEFCGKLVKSKYYEKHLINNHGSGDYPCPQCGKVVNHPEVLERHIKNYHNEFPCEQCGKTMRNRKKYGVHILSFHTPEHLKPYQCEVCVPAKGFHTKTNLREHMNVHSNERPHKCKFCGVGFNSAGNRFAHERSSHLGIKRKK